MSRPSEVGPGRAHAATSRLRWGFDDSGIQSLEAPSAFVYVEILHQSYIYIHPYTQQQHTGTSIDFQRLLFALFRYFVLLSFL